MRVLIFIFSIIIVLFIGACSVKYPELVSVEKVEFLEETESDIIISTKVKVYNPNKFDFSANDVDLSIFIDTSYVGVASIEEKFFLPKKDTSIITCLLYIQKDCLNSNINIKDSVTVNVLGVTTMPYTKKDIYFELQYQIDLSEYIMPIADDFLTDDAIKLKGISLKGISLNQTNLEIVFELYNNTNLEYELTKLSVDLYSNPTFTNIVGSSVLDSSVNIYADTINSFISNVKLNNVSMGTTLFKNTLNNTNFLYMKANLIVNYNELEIPLLLKKKLKYNPLTFEIKINE